MALTPKQTLFVTEYLKCLNATQAAKAAGYAESSAYQAGWENLHKPEIAKTIERHLEASTVTRGELVKILAEQARAEYSKYINEDGTVDLAKMVKDKKAHLIKKIKLTRQGKEIEFHDPQAARDIFAKHYGLVSDRVEHSGSVDVVVKGYATVTPDEWDDNQDTTDRDL